MKCLISDFDGTLYDNNFINNLKSIKEFIDDGNTLMDLVPILMDIFKTSGFFKEDETIEDNGKN